VSPLEAPPAALACWGGMPEYELSASMPILSLSLA